MPRRRKIKQDQFVIFNQQFVTLIHAGLPIIQSLELLIKRQRNPFFRSVLQNVRDRVRGGELLSDAFEAQKVFPKVYTTTLLAGEKSGNLEEVMGRYICVSAAGGELSQEADFFTGLSRAAGGHADRDDDLPHHLCGSAVCEPVPPLGAQLPPMTIRDAGHRRQRQAVFPVLPVVLVAAGFFLWRWMKSDSGATKMDRFKLEIPLLGDIWLKYQVAVFARMLSTLLSGGLSLVPSLETAGESMQSRLMSHGIESATRGVREGQTSGAQPGRDQGFPRDVGGDDRGRRVDRRFAGDAELDRRVL